MRWLLALAVSVLASSARADVPIASSLGPAPQTPWQHWAVQRGALPDVDVYSVRDDVRRPLVVFFPGSHCVPLFFYRQKEGARRLGSTILFQNAVEASGRSFHFAAIERRSLKSFIEFSTADLNDACSPTHGSVSKEDRVKDGADAVRALASLPWVSEVLVAGHSEGADVATGVARVLGDDAHVRAIGVLSGGGPSQFFEHVQEARREKHDAEAQVVFDELLQMTGDERPDMYRGHPFERYESFAIRSTPLDDLKDLHVPVFIAHGSRDDHSAIESADLLAVELLRRDAQRPVRYLVLSGLDHGYRAGDGSEHDAEVLLDFVRWSTAAKPHREVQTRLFVASGGPKPEPRIRILAIDLRYWKYIGLALLALLVLLYVRSRRRR